MVSMYSGLGRLSLHGLDYNTGKDHFLTWIGQKH